MSQSIESAFKACVASVKERLRRVDGLSSFHLVLEARGRVDGQVMVEVKLGESLYGDSVGGRDVEGVLEEFLRRHGWHSKNRPLELPNYTSNDA